MLGRVIKDLFVHRRRAPEAMPIHAVPGDAPRYYPEVFNVQNPAHARSIILTPEAGLTTEQRWETETNYLAGAIGKALLLDHSSLVLDYGCGIGRLSKALITRYGCKVIGVDISDSMRQLALEYVASDAFCVVSPEILKVLVSHGLRVDHSIAIWVLQHCPSVSDDIALIQSSLKKNGLLYVVNNNVSAIPTSKGWASDGSNIRALLESALTALHYSHLPISATSAQLSQDTFVAQYRNDA